MSSRSLDVHSMDKKEEYSGTASSSSSSPTREPEEKRHSRHDETAAINAKLANPLAGISEPELRARGRKYAEEHGMAEFADEFEKGAVIAANPEGFEDMVILSEEDKRVLREERTHKWKQPWELYKLVIMCSVAAAVQGMGIPY